MRAMCSLHNNRCVFDKICEINPRSNNRNVMLQSNKVGGSVDFAFAVWKNILNDEHWLIFNIEMMHVEPWSYELQFQFLDLNNDTFLTQNEVSFFFCFRFKMHPQHSLQVP